MYDLSISIFFSGNGGLVVITMTLLIQLILSAYFSSASGPDSPSHQSHFILLALMEGLIWAGSVAHLYHIHMVKTHIIIYQKSNVIIILSLS